MATIFRNAHLLDPLQELDGRGDVLVENGKIVGILQDDMAIGKIVPILVPQWDTQIVDLEGAFLCPGWIDLHTHIFDTLGDFCLAADDVGMRSGVTVIADAGNAGILTFDAFRRTAIDVAKTRVYAFLDPSLLYIATSDFITHQLEIAANPRNQDVERAAALVEANRDVIVGFKVRPVRRAGESRSPALDAARTLAERFSLPLMVDLGRFPQDETVPPAELLPQLKAGDILSHCFQADAGLFDGAGNLMPVAKDAIARGVLLDVSYSDTSFSLEIAKAAISQGILPHILSTNMNRFNSNQVGGLASVMTKFVHLGLTLSQVVERVTTTPAAVINKSDRLGSFKPGKLADFTIFDWVEAASPLKGSLATTKGLKVKGVCRAGEYLGIERSPFDPVAPTEVEELATPALL